MTAIRLLCATLCTLLTVSACGVWAAPAKEAGALDHSERLQALASVQQAPPDALGAALSYVLGGATVDVTGNFVADLAIDCPGLAAHVRTELSGALQANPALAQAAVQWLHLNGPAGLVTSLALSQLTPELLQKLAQSAPEKLSQFLGWLATETPRTLGEVAQKVMRSTGGGVLDMFLVVARKYPRVAARAVGVTARQCPRLLPRLMRLLVRRGPVAPNA